MATRRGYLDKGCDNVQILPSPRSLSRMILPALLGPGLAGLTGCNPGGGLEAVLLAQSPQGLSLGFTTDKVLIEVVNKTDALVELDLLVDGLPFTIACTNVEGGCDLLLEECPERIEFTEQRVIDEFGGFLGGWEFNGSDNFIYDRGEFECGDTLLLEFSILNELEVVVL